ncbi:T9SS C-terminal target domain-containing protein [Chryseobacterium nematophagum]|uniref:T9SS C-terminal target domain-containing protein n=1 Tax=Chryseobacterium nematophagum TaxID=2305228 RepID=A0A3M7TFR9_9FLAO|nr:T9SS type A sorting domain-containing protein [Chryseobacterium nematophagum]RNA61060.1 T9SS C-terminal target domain-containing protein [Chryseobacterium nematophagum]
MIKKLLFKQLFQCMIFGTVLLFAYTAKAQTCSNTANLPVNGQTTINGVTVTTSSTGSVIYYPANLTVCGGGHLGPYGLAVGTQGVWSLTLTFDQPVNDVIFIVKQAGDYLAPETFTFTSNGGSVTIPSHNSCYSTINGNTIVGGTSQGLGEGTFTIHSSNAYTQLKIDSPGFHAGSTMGICSASIVLSTNDFNNKKERDIVTIYPNPVKNMITISSKETLKSYKIFDESGRLILSSSLKGNGQNVNLSSIKSGNYIISVETEKQMISTKLIKK